MSHPIFNYLIPSTKLTEAEVILCKVLCSYFTERLPIEELSGVDYFLCQVIKLAVDYDTLLTQENLSKICNHHLRDILRDTPKRTDTIIGFDTRDGIALNEAYRILTEQLKQEIILHSEVKVNYDNFKLDLMAFAKERMQEEYNDILQIANSIATVGYQKYQGIIDSVTYMREQLDLLSYYYGDDLLDDYESDIENADRGTTLQTVPVGKIGIQSIDTAIGQLFETRLYGLEASSGAGKTRFTAQTIYNLFMQEVTCIIFCLEQTVAEFEAMLIAHHINHTTKERLRISDSDIGEINKLPKDKQQLINIARAELFSNPHRKNKIIIKSPEIFYVEDMRRILDRELKLNPSIKFIAIDHLYLIESNSPYTRKPDAIIRDAYRTFKRFVRKNNVVGWAINQLNAEGEKAVEEDRDPGQSGAAGGREVYRNTDGNMVMGANKALKAMFKIKVRIVKSRYTLADMDCVLFTQADVCNYIEAKR